MTVLREELVVCFGRQQKKEASVHNQARIVMSGEKGGRLA